MNVRTINNLSIAYACKSNIARLTNTYYENGMSGVCLLEGRVGRYKERNRDYIFIR